MGASPVKMAWLQVLMRSHILIGSCYTFLFFCLCYCCILPF
jgi:hypothetical protein